MTTWRFTSERARLLREAVEGMALKISGQWAGHTYADRRDTPFGSVGEALRVMVVREVDGYSMPPMGDPDRLWRLMNMPTERGGERRDPEPVQEADRLHEVRRAFAAAYEEVPDTGGAMDRGFCELALLARYAAGLTPTDIADRLNTAIALGDTGGQVITPRMVGRVTRYGHQMIAGYLEVLGVVPRRTEGPVVEAKGTTTGRQEADLFGWGEIARHLGRSVPTVQRWARSHGLPVRRFTINGTVSSIEACSEELDSWKSVRTT